MFFPLIKSEILLLLQSFNQLFIAWIKKPKKEVQRNKEFDIYKAPQPEIQIEQYWNSCRWKWEVKCLIY